MTDREGTNEPGGADEVAAAHDALLAGLHSLGEPAESEGGESQTARLQRTMDRQARSEEELANVFKRQQDAAGPLTDNLE